RVRCSKPRPEGIIAVAADLHDAVSRDEVDECEDDECEAEGNGASNTANAWCSRHASELALLIHPAASTSNLHNSQNQETSTNITGAVAARRSDSVSSRLPTASTANCSANKKYYVRSRTGTHIEVIVINVSRFFEFISLLPAGRAAAARQ